MKKNFFVLKKSCCVGQIQITWLQQWSYLFSKFHLFFTFLWFLFVLICWSLLYSSWYYVPMRPFKSTAQDLPWLNTHSSQESCWKLVGHDSFLCHKFGQDVVSDLCYHGTPSFCHFLQCSSSISSTFPVDLLLDSSVLSYILWFISGDSFWWS